ncbi:MAG: AAA family ATPase, partial [Clostridia bacterium]|nr:AAA family ATPase [Clostridia bacterium]
MLIKILLNRSNTMALPIIVTVEELQKSTKKIVAKYNLITGSHYKHLANSNMNLVKECFAMGVTEQFLLENINDLREYCTSIEDYFTAVKIKFENLDASSTDEVVIPKFDSTWASEGAVEEDKNLKTDSYGYELEYGDMVFVKDSVDDNWSSTAVPFLNFNKSLNVFECVSRFSKDAFAKNKDFNITHWRFAQKADLGEDDSSFDDEEGLEEEYEDAKTEHGSVVVVSGEGAPVTPTPKFEVTSTAPKTSVETQETPKPVISPPKAQEAPVVNPKSSETTFQGGTGMDLLVNSLADGMCNTILSKTQKSIDEYVTKTYGALPKIIKVEKDGVQTRVTGITHEVFEDVLNLVTEQIPVFLIGKAGTGKNVICKQIAEGLGLEFYFTNAVTQEYKITGFIDAGGHFHKTQFFEAFTKGGLFFLDEMDASIPEVLIILNAAIANGYFDFPCGKFEAHKDFRIIAAGNTFGKGADYEYTGRNALDSASLDRFAIIEVDYSKKIELAITGNDKSLVKFFREWRKACDSCGISCVASYRGLEYVSKLERKMNLAKALKMGLVKNLRKDDVDIILN